MSLLQKIAKYTYLITRPLESITIKKIGNKASKFQPIFIVGAPRSGSTILYQIITNTFDILYPDNLVEYFHRNFYFGFWLSNLLFKKKPHNCFSSNYGKTNNCGLHAPNECGAFWYRWLPQDRHFCIRDDISPKEKLELKQNIFSIINKHQKPILFKNLNAGQRLDLIHSFAPDAKIIFIKRNPLYTAQSIYKAKRRLKISPNKWWSIKPKNYLELENLPPVEQIVKQVFYIEKQIMDDSKLFENPNFMMIDYSQIDILNPNFYNKIQKILGRDMEKREGVSVPNFEVSENQQVSDELFHEFIAEINKYDWEKYEIK